MQNNLKISGMRSWWKIRTTIHRGLLLFSFIVVATPLSAQIQIGANTIVSVGTSTTISIVEDFDNGGDVFFDDQSTLLVLGQGNLNTQKKITIPHFIMNGSTYNLTGNWSISQTLSLLSGTITPDATAQLIVDQSGSAMSENNAYINGKLYHTGTGEKFYPIGTAGVYTPVTLHGVQGAPDVLVGIEAFNSNLGLNLLPDNVQAASSNWYWSMDIQGTFSGSAVTLPVLPGDEALLAGDNVQPVVLEANPDLTNVTDLGNGLSSDAANIRSNGTALGPYLLLGSKLILVPVIHNIITPNHDEKNDYLIIDAVDVFADNNEVVILDRWGSEVYRKKNFRNFNAFDNLYDGSFDFLSSGNYICILKYGEGQTLKQTITVIK